MSSKRNKKTKKNVSEMLKGRNKVTVEEAQKAPSPSSNNVFLVDNTKGLIAGRDFPPGKYMVTSNKIGEKFSVSTGYHHDKTFEEFTTPQEYTFAHTQELITHDAETVITLILE